MLPEVEGATPTQGSSPFFGEMTGDGLPFTRIGPYTIIRVLGQGGMGVVFLAEQDEPVRRQVAIKVLRAG
ncbi:MAG: hypothetical protein ABI889_11735, partial [Gemmatimonadota bacterium]